MLCMYQNVFFYKQLCACSGGGLHNLLELVLEVAENIDSLIGSQFHLDRNNLTH